MRENQKEEMNACSPRANDSYQKKKPTNAFEDWESSNRLPTEQFLARNRTTPHLAEIGESASSVFVYAAGLQAPRYMPRDIRT